ncbi:MAG: NAD(P)H-hydrate dehydratase [Clostridiales Family XIII bacterium]|jgi:NAD(P)H-hydrate epimerase|nr:NAD(P)H-hydrate dehydratase [Clostridiales Family XIII bacterium]
MIATIRTKQRITAGMVASMLPVRDPAMHKGRAGRVLVAAGSPGMAGAAVLSVGAALRSGAGLVSVGADESLWPILQTREPCAVCVGRPEIRTELKTEGDLADVNRALAETPDAPDAPETRSSYFDGYDAVAIGPGLGTGVDAEYLIARAFADYGGSLILDADALNILARGRQEETTDAASVQNTGTTSSCPPMNRSPLSRLLPLLSGSPDSLPRAVITPHPGEAARLLGVSVADIQSDRPGAAARLADEYGAVAVLKGHASIVAVPPHGDDVYGSAMELFENTTGNPGMATGGSGDALTGVIASFAAQGMNSRAAAIAGVFIHGLAGDLASGERGEYGLIATDIVDALPAAIMRVCGNGRRSQSFSR